MLAQTAVGFEFGGAQLQAHLLQQPIIASQCNASVTAGALPSYVAGKIAKPGLQRAAHAEALTVRRDQKAQLTGNPWPELSDVHAAHGAIRRPTLRFRPADIAAQQGLTAVEIDACIRYGQAVVLKMARAAKLQRRFTE